MIWSPDIWNMMFWVSVDMTIPEVYHEEKTEDQPTSWCANDAEHKEISDANEEGVLR